MSRNLIWTDEGRVRRTRGKPVSNLEAASLYLQGSRVSFEQHGSFAEVFFEHIPSLIEVLQKVVNEPKSVPEKPKDRSFCYNSVMVANVGKGTVKLETDGPQILGRSLQRSLYEWLGKNLAYHAHCENQKRITEIDSSMRELRAELNGLQAERNRLEVGD